MLDFNDGAPDKGDLDHSAHARLQESERRGRLFLPPPGTATRVLHAIVQLQSGYGGDDDGGGRDLNGEFEHIMGEPQCHTGGRELQQGHGVRPLQLRRCGTVRE